MIYLPLPEGTYRYTQPFGVNRAKYAKYGYKGHNGVDIAPLLAGRQGVTVNAPHEGYVKLGNEGKIGYGKYVEILSLPYNLDKTRRKSYLAHLDGFLVKDGQYVGSGDPIGVMGTTGDSTGIHVHWTYKIADPDGNTLNKGNGYGGAIPIGPYTLRWINSVLG